MKKGFKPFHWCVVPVRKYRKLVIVDESELFRSTVAVGQNKNLIAAA